MGADEIKRQGFNEMMGVLCRLQVELELARKSGKKEITLEVGGDLHNAILKAVEIATSRLDKGDTVRRGVGPHKPTAE